MHSFVSCLMHCVWATKERRPLIQPKLEERLWPYLGGIARENKMKALLVGGVQAKVRQHSDQGLIPKVLYYEIPQQLLILRDMVKDFAAGEHMLLIGVQGVGKNVLADKMLELLEIEREYLQLHRTGQALLELIPGGREPRSQPAVYNLL